MSFAFPPFSNELLTFLPTFHRQPFFSFFSDFYFFFSFSVKEKAFSSNLVRFSDSARNHLLALSSVHNLSQKIITRCHFLN